jgi:hypothetical protein
MGIDEEVSKTVKHWFSAVDWQQMPLMQAVQKLVARYDKRLNLHGVYVEK